jgi:3-dehydroquinate dehydratase-2
MKKILVLNGPNLNLLHKRDKKVYGGVSLEKITADLEKLAKNLKVKLVAKQSNSEGELVDSIQKAIDESDGIIINAGAYTHTSVAIRDALEIFQKPKIELHLSNIFKREDFRHHSFLSDVVDGMITGFGPEGYNMAFSAIVKMIDK